MEDRGALFYALLLKDLGCSSNAARLCSLFGADDRGAQARAQADRLVAPGSEPGVRAPARGAGCLADGPRPPGRLAWRSSSRGAAREMVQTRCDRGADIAAMLGFSEATRDAIRTLDEHWDGQRHARGLARPRRSRCWGVSWAWRSRSRCSPARFGVDAAIEMAVERRGRWFDPVLVDALRTLRATMTTSGPWCWAARPSGISARWSPRTRSCWQTSRRLDDHRPRLRPGHRRQVALHLPPFGAGGGAGGDDRPAAALQCPGAARPSPRRSAARHRQARRLHPDPRQAGPAYRAGAGGGPGAPGLHPADPGAGGGVRAGSSRWRARTTSGWTGRGITSASRATGSRR